MLLISGMAEPAVGKNSLCDSYNVMNGQGAKQPNNHLTPVTLPHREKLTKGTNGYPDMESETNAARSCSLLDLADAACNELQAISHKPDVPLLSRDHRIQLDGNISTNPGSRSRSELLQLLSIPPPHQLSSPSPSPATFPLSSTNATLQEVTPTVVRSWNGSHSQREVTLSVNEVAQTRKRHVQSKSREPVAKARKKSDAVIANPGFPPNYTIHPNSYSAIEMACSKSRSMFSCKKCSVVYCTRADIVEHVNKKHWMDYPGRLLCKECLVLTKKPNQFKKHVFSVHPNSEPYHYIPGKILENLQNSLIVPPDESAGETRSEPDQHVTLAHSLTTIGNAASVSSCSTSSLSRTNQISNTIATKDHINGSNHNLPNVATAISPTLNMTSQPFRSGEVTGLTFTSRPPTNIAESHSYQTVPLHQMSPNTTPNVSSVSGHQDSKLVIQSPNVSGYEPSRRINMSAIPSIIHTFEPIKSTHQTVLQFPHMVVPEAQTVRQLASSPHLSGFPVAYSAPPHLSLPKSKQTGSLSTSAVRPRQSSMPDTDTDILLSPPETMLRPQRVDNYAFRNKVPPTPIVITPLLPHKSASSTKEALSRRKLSKQMSAAMVTVPASVPQYAMRQPVQQSRVLVFEPDTIASASDSQLMTNKSATMLSIPHQAVGYPSIPTAVNRNTHVPGGMPLFNNTVTAQISPPIQQRHELPLLGQYGHRLPYPRFSPNSSIHSKLHTHPTFNHLPVPRLFPPSNMQMRIGPRPMHQHDSHGLLDFPPKTKSMGHESKTYNVPYSNSKIRQSISSSDKFPFTNTLVRHLERIISKPAKVVAKAASKTAMRLELARASATLSFEAMDAHTGTSVTTRQDKPTRASINRSTTDVLKDKQMCASRPASVSKAIFVGAEGVDLLAAKKKRRPPVNGVAKPSMISKKRSIQKDQSMNKSQCSTSAWMTRSSTVIEPIVSRFDETLTSPTSVTHLVPHHVHGNEVIESPSTTIHNSRYTDGDSASTICKSMPTDCSDAAVGPLSPHNTDPSMSAGHSTSYTTDSSSFTSLTAMSVDSQISKIHAQPPENQTSADVVEPTDIQTCSSDGAPDINDDAVSKDSGVDLERSHISDIDELSKQEEESQHLGIVDNKSDTHLRNNETDSSALLASSSSLPFVKSVSGLASVIHSKETLVSNGDNESQLILSKTLYVQCEFDAAQEPEFPSPAVEGHACESMVTSDEVQGPGSQSWLSKISNAKTNIEDDDSFSSTSLPDIESCDDDQIATTAAKDPHEEFREIAKRALGTCQVDSQLDAHVIDKYKALSSDDEDGCLTHRESLPVKARVVKAKPKPRSRLSVLKEKKELDKPCTSDAHRQKSSEHSDYDSMPELACSKKKRRLLNHRDVDNEPGLTSSPKISEIDSLRQVTSRILGTSDQMASMASQLETLLDAPVPAEIPTGVDQLNMRQLPEVTPISNSGTFFKAWGCKEQTATTLQCYVCSFQCKTEKAMFGHCGRHISVNPFSCSVCFIQKRTADAVARHIRIDHRFCHATVCTENNMLNLRDSLCNNLFGYCGERFERGKNESIHLLLASGFVSFIPHLRYIPSNDEDVSRAVDEAIRRLCPSPVNKEVYADRQQPLRISSWDVLNGMIEDHSAKPEQSPKVDPANMSKFSRKLFDGMRELLSASGIKKTESVSPVEAIDVSNIGSCEPNNNGTTPDREIAEAFRVHSEQKEITLKVFETAQGAVQHKPMSLCDDKLLMYPVIVLHRL